MFNLLPLHVGHVYCSAINEAYHSLDHDDVVSSNLLFIKVLTPFNRFLLFRNISTLLDTVDKLVYRTNKIILNSF